jgi:hypothetical protein
MTPLTLGPDSSVDEPTPLDSVAVDDEPLGFSEPVDTAPLPPLACPVAAVVIPLKGGGAFVSPFSALEHAAKQSDSEPIHAMCRQFKRASVRVKQLPLEPRARQCKLCRHFGNMRRTGCGSVFRREDRQPCSGPVRGR